MPSRFDAWYCYHLGLIAGALVVGGHTGYMASLTELASGGTPIGIPLTCLFTTEDMTEDIIASPGLIYKI